MENNSLKEIGKVLQEAKNIVLLPHINADGDALGSCMSLCRSLISMGKKCVVLTEEEIPDYLAFLNNGYAISFEAYKNWQLPSEKKDHEADFCKECEAVAKKLDEILSEKYTAVWVDCSGRDRIPERTDVFNQAKNTVCIDHHKTSAPEADFNYIDPSAAATGEIVYMLLREMNAPLDKEIGEAIFTALTTDTGNFQYSNTTKKTFETMVALMDLGIDISSTSNLIYQNAPLCKIVINNKILSTMEIFAEGAGAVAHVTQQMLKNADAKMEHTEGVINTLRSIKGVEIAAFLKEIKEDRVKVTMRAKSHADVAAICVKYGGGGHTKAAGCTLEMSISEAKTLIIEEISKALCN